MFVTDEKAIDYLPMWTTGDRSKFRQFVRTFLREIGIPKPQAAGLRSIYNKDGVLVVKWEDTDSYYTHRDTLENLWIKTGRAKGIHHFDQNREHLCETFILQP